MWFLLFAMAQLTEVVPPPPPIRQEQRPPVPQPIRVGCNVQAAYVGPVPQWYNAGPDSLSDQQIAELEDALHRDPGNVCARGYLIAHGQDRVARRIEHVLWMVEHRPEWEGFLLSGSSRVHPGGSSPVRAAWLRRMAQSPSGMVLHHAAVYFMENEPHLAEELYRQAIGLEPEIALHREGLGRLYGRHAASVSPFSATARSVLMSSEDTVVLAGANDVVRSLSKGGTDLGRAIEWRLRSLAGGRLPDLPSRSGEYRQPSCELVPLLRRCEDVRKAGQARD